MSSAKTLNLLASAHSFDSNDIEVLCLKPATDTRDGIGTIKSRAGLERSCIMIDEDSNVYIPIEEYASSLSKNNKRLGWVLIDEAQFLTEEQVDQLSDVVDNLDINVVCYGLRTDFKTKMFPGAKRLFELADTIEEIKLICQCGRHKAIVNARVDDNGNIVHEGEQVLIGGDESYRPLCRRCWKSMKIFQQINDTNAKTSNSKMFY